MHIGPGTARRYPAQLLDRAGDWVMFGTALVTAVLARSLGDRAVMVAPIAPPDLHWGITTTPPDLRSLVLHMLSSHNILPM